MARNNISFLQDTEEDEHERYQPGTLFSKKSSTTPYLFEPSRPITNRTQVGLNKETVPVFPTGRFCECNHCGEKNDIVCCKWSEKIRTKMDCDQHSCITKTESFKTLILRKDVLQLAFQRTLALRKKRRKSSKSDIFSKETARFTAYGQFVFWIHTHLGQNIRKILPTCVYKAIRTEYPSEDGTYTEFTPGINDDIFID
jgi:hypothetical protein